MGANLGRIIKFVAVMMILGLLALPLSATVACLSHGLSSSPSDRECPMKSYGLPGTMVMGSTPGQLPCCQASSVPPVIKSAGTREEVQRWLHVAQIERAVSQISAATLHRPANSEPTSPPTSSSHRALLCVFLI